MTGALLERLPQPILDRLWMLTAFLRERRLRRGAARIGLVLVYHRTGTVSGDPNYEIDPALRVDLFERQLRHLKRRYRVVSADEILDAAASRLPGGRFPVAITLDDDLRSHLTLAAPALQRLSLPATVFLTGAFLHDSPSPWWNDLQRAVDRGALSAGDIPGAEELVQNALERQPRAARRLARAVQELPPDVRDETANRLHAIGGQDGAEAALSKADLGALVRSGLAVGFHTLRHYDLRTLDDGQLAQALEEGREALAAAVGRELSLIAYPHGKCDERVAAAARAAGFGLGFTGVAEPVRAGDDPLRLGRLQPPQRSAGRFALDLANALRGAARA